MKRGLFALALVAAGAYAFGTAAGAAPTAKPKLPGTPLPSETAFVQSVTRDLNARFPTPADAEKAGYFRFTNEDNTGAISYANLQWDSKTPQEPSQLWYSVGGKLLGADYSVPLADSATAPHLWGVDPARWFVFRHPHVHYMLKQPNGSLKYSLAVSGSAFTKAGGNLADPQAETLVKMGKAANASAIAKLFTFPAEWDLELWVTPNPNGAFAQKNPLVHPSKNAESGEM